jgi:hypothetical protein
MRAQNASYRLDAEHSVVVGLPIPREGTWATWRSYGLTETLLGVALKMLPNRGYPVDMHRLEDTKSACGHAGAAGSAPLAFQRKLSHLAVFARALLPPPDTPPALGAHARALLDSDGAPSLAALRAAAPGAHVWRENQGVRAHALAPGDVGRVARGATLGDGFEKLGNVLEEGLVDWETEREVWCKKSDFQAGGRWEEVQGFPMGPDVMGCATAMDAGRGRALTRAQVAARGRGRPEAGRAGQPRDARAPRRGRVGVPPRARRGARRALRRPARRARPRCAPASSPRTRG